MSEETTDNLNSRGTFEERVLAELASISNRLSSLETKVDRLEAKVDRLETRIERLEARVDALEEKVDERLRETRPIWEAVLARVKMIDAKLDILQPRHVGDARRS